MMVWDVDLLFSQNFGMVVGVLQMVKVIFFFIFMAILLLVIV